LKVWKESTLLGIGVAKSGDDGYVVVCNYFKAGNIDGEFEKNVSPRVEVINNEVFLISELIYFLRTF
jgi:hypothetical protein